MTPIGWCTRETTGGNGGQRRMKTPSWRVGGPCSHLWSYATCAQCYISLVVWRCILNGRLLSDAAKLEGLIGVTVCHCFEARPLWAVLWNALMGGGVKEGRSMLPLANSVWTLFVTALRISLKRADTLKCCFNLLPYSIERLMNFGMKCRQLSIYIRISKYLATTMPGELSTYLFQRTNQFPGLVHPEALRVTRAISLRLLKSVSNFEFDCHRLYLNKP